MNLQTERIEKHRAQFTIEIEADRLEEAKRKAARKISRQVRIKGFRKGRAPYRLVAQYVGEGAILEEALDDLGDALYKQALDESDFTPYGPGAFEDFKIEPAPTFVFSLPLQPEVDLKAYLEVRLEYEDPTVAEGEVDVMLRQMRLRQVEVLDDEVAVAGPGHRVTIAVDSEFIDGDPPEEPDEIEIDDALTADTDEASEDAPEEPPAPYLPKRGDTFVHDENAQIILDPNEDPFVHGFVGNIIGVERGSDIEFELTIPDDDAEETIVGRRVSFIVTLKAIEEIAVPELDDEFARRAGRERGDEQLDLAGLRQSVRAELQRSVIDRARSQFSAEVLQEIVDGAEIAYAEVMLDEQIDEMIKEFEGNLKQQRLNLEEYMRLTQTTRDDLREQYRERATASLRQSLVLRELVSAQEIEIDDDLVERRLEGVVAGYGASPELRKLFNTPQMRGNIRNELLMSHINAHLVAIGRGQDPAAAIEEMQALATAEAERASERNERRRRYRAEDTALADAAGDQAGSAAPPATEAIQALEGESAATDDK